MDRRSFLKTSALAGTGAATLAAPAYAQGKRTLTMVTSWGRGLAGVFDAAQQSADLISALTDGQLTVDIKAAGELVGAFEVFDAVSSGQADMYHAAEYYFLNQHPAYAYFTGVPFGLTSTETNIWYTHGGGKELHDELGQIFGLKTFLAGNTGTQAGGWYRKEINSEADFQGLKLRMPGLGGQAMGKLGASVQAIPGGEVYQALASGALDATEWIGPWADEKAGFQEITKFYYASGFHEPGVALALATNRDVFEDLSPAHQTAIETAASVTNSDNLSLFISNHGPALQRLKSAGVKVLQFNDGIWDAFGRASTEVMDSYMDDELFAKIRNSAEASRGSTSGWISQSEAVFVAQRDRVLGG
ncbi:MAG: twin-arginine translocation signal domain-containing protein [Cognatishimia sp.]|uniref:TRAP transporter substrate-binding protein n=1 Tax=Cognatishimia sp. TaxID=2211648 RepID=UPI003B8D3F7C